MDKELENILRQHFERKKELGQKSWDKISHLFEVIDGDLNFKQNITDDGRETIRKNILQHYKDFRNLEFQTHAKFQIFSPKDDYNDFAKCFLTQDILNHMQGHTNVLINRFENDLQDIYIKDNGRTIKSVHGIGIDNVQESYLTDSEQLTRNQKKFIYELYTQERFKEMKNTVLENCGESLKLMSANSFDNNLLLAKITNFEIAK